MICYMAYETNTNAILNGMVRKGRSEFEWRLEGSKEQTLRISGGRAEE